MNTYTNSFHNTEARSKYSADELELAYEDWHTRLRRDLPESPAFSAVRRISRKLCPVSGCTCGDWLGRRG